MEAPSNSFAEITPKEDLTINPCPSKKLIPVNSKPRFTSLEKVQVVTLESKSTSPPARTGNLDLLVVVIYSTLSGSENIADDTALHTSTSKPLQLPSVSTFEKPINGSETPHLRYPLSLTSSSTKALIG